MTILKGIIISLMLGCSSLLWSQINPQVESLLNTFYTLKYAYDYKNLTMTESIYNSSHDGLCFEARVTFYLDGQSWETSNAVGHNQILRRTRLTLDELSQNAESIHKWETHSGKHDTINYAMFLKPGAGNLPYQNHMINIGDRYWATGGLESINMEYIATHPTKEELIAPMRLARGTLTYKCVLDTLAKATECFNTESYCDAIKSVVNKKGISMRKVHYKQDGYIVKNDEFFVKGDTEQATGDTYGIHYIIRSEDIALTVLNQLREKTKEYIATHPNEAFSMFNPRQNDYISTFPFLSSNTTTSENDSGSFTVFTVFSKSYYHILVLYTNGTLCIPTNWEIIKDFDNGVVKYYENDMKYMSKTNK